MLNVKFNRSTCNIDIYNHNCNKISSTFIWLLNAILNLLVKRNQIWLWHKISPLPYESKLSERHPSGQISAVHLCPAVLGRGGAAAHSPAGRSGRGRAALCLATNPPNKEQQLQTPLPTASGSPPHGPLRHCLQLLLFK